MKNYSIVQFLITPIVFSEKIRNDIRKYLIIILSLALILEAFFIFTGFPWVKGSLLFATMMLILMPFFLYFGYVLKRVVKTSMGKQKKDKSIKFWILGKMFFNLMAIILTYFWLTLMLLIAAMCIITV